MAVVNRPCGDFHCARSKSCMQRTSKPGWVISFSTDLVFFYVYLEFVIQDSGLREVVKKCLEKKL